MVPTAGATDVYADFRKVRPWSSKERLGGEKETLGLYISGHPIDEYESEVRKFAPTRIADLRADAKGDQVIAGLVNATRTMKTQRGTMAVLQLDDRTARIEVTVYSETYNEHRELLQKDNIIILEGRVAEDDYNGGLVMRARGVRSLDQARQDYASELTIRISDDMVSESFTDQLQQTLASAVGGSCPVWLEYSQPHNRARVRFGERWQVVPSDELLQALKECVGSDRVSLNYR